MNAATPLAEYLRDRCALVDKALERYLPAPPRCPDRLAEAMRYSVMAGGKRLRPILTLAAAETVGGDDTAAHRHALPAACALEFIHTYSLMHDDLPAMDDDSLRRGRPTSHVVFGDALAILAGDALLTEAFGLLASEPASTDPDMAGRRLHCLAVVAEAAGARGMVGGQVMDLDPDVARRTAEAVAGRGPGGASVADVTILETIHRAKTGALITAAATAGAIMGGGSPAEIEAIDGFAAHLGLAFQIVDDVLDVEGGREELGKTPGKDAAAGKLTYPSLVGIVESRRLASSHIDFAKAALRGAGLYGRLEELADWAGARSH